MVGELIDQYGLDIVQAYMSHIQTNAEVAVRDMLKEVAKDAKYRTGSSVLEAEDFMDDGSPIKLKVVLDEQIGSALCDFRYFLSMYCYCFSGNLELDAYKYKSSIIIQGYRRVIVLA